MKRFKLIEKNGVQRRVLLYIAFAVFLLAFFYYIGALWSGFTSVLRVLQPLFYGIALAFILNIPMTFLERKLIKRLIKKEGRRADSLRRALALVLTLILAVGFFVLLFVIILPKFITNIYNLIEAFPAYWQDFITWSSRFVTTDELTTFVSEQWAQYGQEVTANVLAALQDLVPRLFGFTASIASGIANLVFSFIFAVYMLYGKERLCRQLVNLLTVFASSSLQAKVHDVAVVTNRCFHNFISGQCIEALILGSLTYLGSLILQLPYALILGVLVGVTSVIPVVGAFLGAIPCVLLLLFIDPLQAVIFVIFLVILQQIEGNVIYPRVVGGSVGLSGLWVLAAVVVGSGFLGVFGILLAVPLFATVGTLLTEMVERRLAERKTEVSGEPS